MSKIIPIEQIFDLSDFNTGEVSKAWEGAEEREYTPKTTMWGDFAKAEKGKDGMKAVKSLFDDLFAEYKSTNDTEAIIELAIVMQDRAELWRREANGNKAALNKRTQAANYYTQYSTLFLEVNDYACDNFKGDVWKDYFYYVC
jgi:hypothetical protein